MTFWILRGVVLLVSVIALAPSAAAQGYPYGSTVTDTFHNLRRAATAGPSSMRDLIFDYGEVCVYCHTPHNATTAVSAPLWNRSAPTGPYTMYSSPTIDMTIAASPQGVSLACLSCHDGTVALDAVVRPPRSWTAGTDLGGGRLTQCQGCHSGSSPAGGYNFSGLVVATDLSNDHPISITYDTTRDSAFTTPTAGRVGSLPLYGTGRNQVECGSCHNPHDNTNRTFLRVANTNSALCTACHIK